MTYDAGALIAIERRSRKMKDVHNHALANGVTPVVPAGVLAQIWRGGSGRQAPVAQVLKQCQVEPLSEGLAKKVGEAGKLLSTLDVIDVVDISVVISALARGDRVVTSDPKNLKSIMGALDQDLLIINV